ncbi:malonyl-CoA decarboxylase [Rhodovarius crocodyli]|uniref:Malonyl-CoA decarboxylase n=1 Tax=Rhodovarius crocodyli TaxID=1979269 RepID=A0A437LX21_9PROT|nr:malonyl-CoA decarboxylase [Rhodovarius crocodyli]RVT89945.1 malonyl-CoA decarboxylase [Rhodovarius crocodyli]
MSEVLSGESLIDRALKRVTALWRERVSPGQGEPETDLTQRMQACLDARGGEVSARARAASLAHTYLEADIPGRRHFLRTLAGFDSDVERVTRAVEALAKATDAEGRAAAKVGLRQALEPPRLKLLHQLAAIPDGVKLLVDMRAELLGLKNGDALLSALEADLRNLFVSWFDLGFLELRRIDWNSPAALLEKLVAYEAVHRIRTWRDLKNRLDSDRRCYAYFHPRMPSEPLIFVEVALVQGLSGSVQKLLDEKAPVLDPKEADTAIFYSINNCQRGLDGIAFGNFLIKRVVEVLGGELRSLKNFATLSPIPGFTRWLAEREKEADDALLTEAEALAIRQAAEAAEDVHPTTALCTLLKRKSWPRDAAMVAVLEPVLTRLCARYLVNEAGRNPKRARDPVGHFHLSNGARVERINWLADTSPKGFAESAGLMVNYLYDLAKIEDQHEAYAGEGKRAASTPVKKLLKA